MRRITLQLLLLAIAAAPVRAQLIDHQPLNTGGPASDTQFLDLFGRESWQLLADDFSLDSDAAVRRVSWWGFYDQDNPPASEIMRIRFYSARPGDGLPGEVLYDQTVLNPSRTATGRRVGVTVLPKEYFYQANLAVPLSFLGQTGYWLEIAQVGDGTTAFRWEFSQSDTNNFAYLNRQVPDWQIAPLGASLAFQLTPVPEPPPLCFLLAVAYLATAPRRHPA